MSAFTRWLPRGGRTRRDRPVPGVEDTGLVGWHKPPAAGARGLTPPSPRPLPGTSPAIPRHDTGGLDYAVKVWKCGCILLFDGQGRITGTTPCQAPDIDTAIRRILDAP